MKLSEMAAAMREFITLPTKGSLKKAVILLVVIVVCAVGLSILLLHFLPSQQEAKQQFANWGYAAIFVITLVTSFTVILPVPGVVVWSSLVISLNLNPAWAALIASVGGTLGEVTGYYLGYAGRAVIAPEQSERYRMAEEWMKRYGGLTIGLFAFFPFLIFDFVGIAAGVLKYPLRKFLIYCWLGRIPRSFIECYVYYYTGKTLIDYIL